MTGVTDRPGIDVESEPPAVRMNEELGGLLTYKLAGEDALRCSGLPYCVVRPCALTEEPAGAPLQLDQGEGRGWGVWCVWCLCGVWPGWGAAGVWLGWGERCAPDELRPLRRAPPPSTPPRTAATRTAQHNPQPTPHHTTPTPQATPSRARSRATTWLSCAWRC